jgi:hypothetical protein
MIIECMIKGRRFLYQTDEGAIYHVAEVEQISSWESHETIVAFVDGDSAIPPKKTLSRSSVQIIVASSPKGTYSAWAKQLGPGSFVNQIVIKLWSQKELLLTGLVLPLLLTLD